MTTVVDRQTDYILRQQPNFALQPPAKRMSAGSNELECIQQRTSAIHEELSSMTPKMADQFSTLRRELKDVQRSLADLQRRLPTTHVDPVEEDRRRSIRAPTMERRYQSEADSDVVDRCSTVDGRPSPAGERLSDGRGVRRLPVPTSPEAGASMQRQDATDDEDDDSNATNISNNPTSTTGDDATAMFTLCL